jgi:hypothetical protein
MKPSKLAAMLHFLLLLLLGKVLYSSSHSSMDQSHTDSESVLARCVDSFVESNGSEESIASLCQHGLSSSSSSSSLSSSSSNATRRRWSKFLRQRLIHHIVSHALFWNESVCRLLANLVTAWSDYVVYETMVHSEPNKGVSLLTVLQQQKLWSTDNQHLLLVLSLIWQALERLDLLTQNRHFHSSLHAAAWWLDMESMDWHSLAKHSWQSLVNQHDPLVTCNTHMTILTHLLHYQLCDWVSRLNETEQQSLVDRLMLHVMVWQQEHHSTTTDSILVLEQGLHALRLMSLLQARALDAVTQQFDTMLRSMPLVNHVLQMAVPNTTTSTTTPSCTLVQAACRVIQTWWHEQGEAWNRVLALESQATAFVTQSWTQWWRSEDWKNATTCHALLLWHTICPQITQQALNHVLLQQEDADMADRCLSLMESSNDLDVATTTAALLRHHVLLDKDMLQKFLKQPSAMTRLLSLLRNKVQHSSQHPLLIILLDLLSLLPTHESLWEEETQIVETLICLTQLVGPDEDGTPPTHNLSRIPDDPPETRLGLTPLVALAAATLLAAAPPTPSIQRGVLLPLVQNVTYASWDHCARHLGLLRLVAPQDHNDMIVTTLWNHHAMHRQQIASLKNQLQDSQTQLQHVSERVQHWQKQTSHAQQCLEQQSVLATRRLRGARMEAMVQNQREVDRRLRAEERAQHELQQQQHVAENKLREIQKQAEQDRAKLMELLHAERTKVHELETQWHATQAVHQERDQQLTQLVSKLKEIKDEVEEKDKMLQGAMRQLDEKNSELTLQRNDTNKVEGELEAAYEKLVSLAQILEIRQEEQEETTQRMERELRSTKRKLEKEIQRNEALEEEVSKTQRENETLLRKLERAKEKLELERREQDQERERRKRTGPVSYVNSLHRESQRSSASSKEHRYNGGKENSYYSTSSFNRSTRIHGH